MTEQRKHRLIAGAALFLFTPFPMPGSFGVDVMPLCTWLSGWAIVVWWEFSFVGGPTYYLLFLTAFVAAFCAATWFLARVLARVTLLPESPGRRWAALAAAVAALALLSALPIYRRYGQLYNWLGLPPGYTFIT